jgi:ParB-like nuclease domain
METAPNTSIQSSDYRDLPITQPVESPTNPRRRFDESALRDLAESIRTRGVLAPLLVREVAGERFEVVAGSRRYRSAQLEGATSIPGPRGPTERWRSHYRPGGQRKRPSHRFATTRSQNKSCLTCVPPAALLAGLLSHSSMHETDQWQQRKHWTPRGRPAYAQSQDDSHCKSHRS